MPTLSITFYLTAIFAVMLVFLSVYTSLRRRDMKLAYGDAGDSQMNRRIRAHGNFVENAPFLILLTGALEYTDAPAFVVALVALAFLVARGLHAYDTLFGKKTALRAPAMLIQHIVMVVAAIYLVAIVAFPVIV